MIEPVITPRPARRRATIAVVVAALLASAGGLAIALNSGDDGDQRAVSARGKVAAQTGGDPAPAALPASESADGFDSAGAGSSSRMIAPGWGGLDLRYQGDLPDLARTGSGYGFHAPEFDGADAARLAKALGLRGTPAKADGGWSLKTADGSLQIFPGTDGWSINFQRAGSSEGVTGRISAADAERTARALLGQMGVFSGPWQSRVYESQASGGYDFACEEALKLREAEITGEGVPASDPGARGGTEPAAPKSLPAPCAEPSEPVFAQNVNFLAVLDGIRTDWTGWSVNVRADNVVDAVYGTLVDFRKGDTYDLRSVQSALDELRGQTNGTAVDRMPMPMPMIDEDAPPASSGAGSVSSPGSAGSAQATTVAADTPVSSDGPEVTSGRAPLVGPPICGEENDCKPQVVTLTSVEVTMIATGLWTDGTYRMHLVPGYRFTGHFADGDKMPYEASVLAIDPALTLPPPGLKDSPPAPTQAQPPR